MPVLACVLLAAAGAWAQDSQDVAVPAFDAQLFQPSVDAPTLLGTDDSFVPDELGGSGRLLLQWAHQPLVYVPYEGEPTDVVGELFQLDVIGGVAWHRVRVGVDLPVVLRSVGDLTGGETGLGDLSLDLKGRLLDRRSHPVGLALAGRLSVPSATTAAPCCLTSGRTSSMRCRPFSMLMELTTQRPGAVSSAARITCASVESIISGGSTLWLSSLTSRRIWAASSGRSVSATHTSSTCAPPSTCSRATSRMPS